ncbi:hypothetical protein DU500_16345 [Haloplanus rubicundus]|uniref:DUF4352 domain-containing protein n=1 Tax=Haloplanus rubicundus TaxID=1547898 RepID=A0A345E6P9_9EURY|nr:hypothetical protein [Haloplanus rubicundus]AXG07871.1 hypothetical protein DU500_16345 [Haloplanus rubicundus]
MRRRAFLASAGIAALAGCSSGNDDGDGSDGTATPTATSTGTGTPNFELRGAEIPEARALNVPTAIAVAVQNTGTGAGTFTSTLERRVDDGEWETAANIEMPLEAGETGEWHSPRFAPRYLATLHFRLAAFDETWSMEIAPKRLDFGLYYAAPTGLYLNVLGGSFESEYPAPSNETDTTANETLTPTAAPDGETWAIMRVDVRNRLEEPQTTPAADEFVLTVDGEPRPQHQEVTDDPYEGGELAGRTVTRGDLVYSVPAGTQARDITITWESSLPDGDVKAIWTK